MLRYLRIAYVLGRKLGTDGTLFKLLFVKINKINFFPKIREKPATFQLMQFRKFSVPQIYYV